MAKNPDPSYWGNPPQTPTRHSSSTHSEHPAQPVQLVEPSQPTQSLEPTTPFTPAPSRKHRGCIIAVIIALILVVSLGIAGCVACTNLLDSRVSYQTNQSYPFALQPSTPQPSTNAENSLNNEFFRDAFDLDEATPNSSLSTDELNSIQSSYFSDSTKKPNEEGFYSDGVYFVRNDLPEGSYWFTGEDDSLSFFFILDPTENNDTYDVVHINNYYGHNLMEVKNGEVLVLVNKEGMKPLDSLDETFSAPYQSGTYRVGTDIPAGTYQLQLGTVDDYSACYVMSDLSYSQDSYLFEAYYIKGDKPEEITLDNGTYIELYNMSMTPVVM